MSDDDKGPLGHNEICARCGVVGTMFKVMKQVVDGAGLHRWTAAGPAQYPTEGEAEKGLRRATLASLRGPHAEGYRCARFRIAPVLAAVACLVLQ